MKDPTASDLYPRLAELNQVGIKLSSEKNIDRLLEAILLAAKNITNADGGTLYRVYEKANKGKSAAGIDGGTQHRTYDRELRFAIMRTDSLGIAMGGTTGKPIPYAPVQLYDEEGRPNNSMVVAYSVLHDCTVNIADAYTERGFDFSGTKSFDRKTGYRSQSFLTVPMKNHEDEIIGVLQLINAKDRATGAIVPFPKEDQNLAESLASQAAVALTNRELIDQLQELFQAFIKLINAAIDDKSPYTGGHCERVPELTMMLAEAVNNTTEGPLRGFAMTEKDRYELKIAGLLHDCGKITTPVHVVDKATKLQTIYDRIGLIDTRFEVLKRDAEIRMLRAKLEAAERGEKGTWSEIEARYSAQIKQYEADRQFLRFCNVGSERMAPEDQQRVFNIGTAYRWHDVDGTDDAAFLSDDEIRNLTIRSGTLTEDERKIINHHIEVTIDMLEALPWPKHLKNVPEYAGGHHERMDGGGYPKGLRREQMSVQARVMGIADIFEALTAKDRPYKKGKTLTEALTILGRFKLNGHIDPDLFDIFIRERVYLKYAEQFLDAEQIDHVDLAKIPGVPADALP